MDPQHVRLDITQAPLLRGHLAHDPANDRWLLGLHTHHLIVDHTSLELLVDEILLHLQDRSTSLPPALPFRDFVAQARLGTSEETHRRFFTEQLGDVLAPTTPFGLSEVRGDGAEIEEASLALPAALCTALRVQARRLDASAASLFHLAYALVLAQASNQDDVVFGTALFGRLQGGNGADRVMGMFLNTLPIRLQRDGRNVVEAVRQTQQQLAQLLQHEHATLALAQRCSGIQAPTPLFTALLNYRHVGGHAALATDDPAEDPWHGIALLEARERNNYPLSLAVDDTEQSFLLTVKVQQGYGAERIARQLNDILQQLVDALVQTPSRPLHALPLLPRQQHNALLGHASTSPAVKTQACLHHLFAQQVARTPDAIALRSELEQLSYHALDCLANTLAHRLIDEGIGPDVRVAVCMERCIAAIVAMLGVLKAGGAYVPLDPALPAARLRDMLEDCSARAMVIEHTLPTSLRDGLALPTIVMTEVSAHADARQLPPVQIAGLGPQHLAYVMYTSGSTGRPKAVMVTHHGLVNYALALIERCALQPDDTSLVFTSLHYDLALTGVYPPLLCGATVQVCDPDSGPAAWLQAVRQGRSIAPLKLTPSHLALLQQEVGDADISLDGCVRALVLGGEAPALDALRWWRARAPSTRIFNHYGPTETTVGCVMHEVCADDTTVPLGRALAGNRLYVLDRHMQLSPRAATGELYVAGAGLARGYLDQPVLTAERFVPDPFAAQPGQRMYRTGDLARWCDDGTVAFLGRNDEQIKLRGFRIEPGEIAAALRACPGVQDAHVQLRQDGAGMPRLVAYLVTTHPDDADPSALRQALSARLPEAMLPAAYVRLATLPLTKNGKLDRRALPAPGIAALAVQAYAAPVGERETLLAALWCDLLGVERVGRHDSFFALGGHSLLAVRLISRLRSALGLELPLTTLFARPQLAELANALDDAGRSSLPAIVRNARTEPLPLSFAQQRLWFLQRLNPQAALAYLMPGGVDLHGTLDVAALQSALDRIVARHEALRTIFPVADETAAQCILPADIGLALRRIDLRAVEDPDAEAEHHAALERDTIFDLARGPLIRGRLLQLADQRYRLLLTMHHLVSDGWSMGLLVRELSLLYAAYAQGQPDPLPPLSIQYADYARWQQRWITDAVLERQRRFWIAHLQDAPALLELPSDRPRPACQDHRGETIEIALDPALTTQLRVLSQRHGTTLFMTLLAGWGVLLARLAGQDQVVIGNPVANRTRSELEPLIGLFVNTQALHIDLRGNPSVAQLLARVRHAAIAAQDHQELPFEQVIEAVNPVRSLAAQPLFQAMLIWQNTADADLLLPGLKLAPLPLAGRAAKFDLELSLHEQQDRIVGSLGYATALFDRSTIERQRAQFVRVLGAMTADPHTCVAQLPVLPAGERARLQRFTVTETAPAARAHCVHHLFDLQVQRTPEAIALIEGERQLRYAELEARANLLAQRLVALGVGLEDLVALYLPRGIAQVVALLATLKAGAAYLPLDPQLPSERLAFVLDDSQPRLVLTCDDLLQRLPRAGSLPGFAVLNLDADMTLETDALARNPAAPLVPELCPEHLAYVIYTSGSTGQPKGTLLTHAGAAHYLQWAIETYRPQPSAVVSSSLAFDATLTSLLAPLLCGATVELLPEHGTLDALRQRLCDPTPLGLVKLTPAHLEVLGQQLVDHREPLSPAVMVIGGEALSAATLARWQTLAPHTRLINEYGPTETVVGCVVHEATADDATAASGRVPIGHPIAHLRVYILDAFGQPAPIGVAGQLHIAGPQLARGYLGRPALTAERFVPDPFAERPGQRMYRSGDIGCWRADGTLDYLGRNDEQVKLRGHRIELGEIAAALRACAGVEDAAVVLREDSIGEPRLVAYLVGDVDQHVAAALSSQLAPRLPEVMLPSAYVHLDALPLTPNGKLDRRALPAPETDRFPAQAYLAPEGELETQLAELWSALLGVERIGRHDSFFALGGHSLLAVRLVSRIRSALGLELPLAAVFAQPRLADLTQALHNAAISTLPAIVPADRNAPLPLSFAQQRLWFLAQLDAQAALAYLVANGLRLRGRLDRQALRRALDRIAARHESLRTRIVLHQDEPTQCIDSETTGFRLHEHDLSTHPDPHREVRRLAELETHTPFDLARDTLARAQLLRLGDEEHVLLVTLHHLIADGWSMGVLMREFSTLYPAFVQGQPDPLPPLPIQSADIAVWQRRWLAGERLQHQRDFWIDHLHDAPALLELPTDHPRPAVQDARGETLELELDVALSEALRELSQRHGTTLFMTLLAAWGVLLARLSGQDQVVIGTPTANRTRSELEPLIGLFVNTQALHIDLRRRPSVRALLAQVRATALAAQAHQDLPFEQVIDALNPPRSLAHHPVFQVMFAWHNMPDSRIELPGLAVDALPLSSAMLKFDLDLALQEQDGVIVGRLAYATALFDSSTIVRHLAQFMQVLRGMVADADACVTRLALVSPEEHAQLASFNVTAASLQEPDFLHQQIAAQAQRTPDAIAVIDGQTELSYAALDTRANQLAHHLIGVGVTPERVVAICLPRGSAQVIALLAILKAGAAYLPLDIEAPAARLHAMVADAGAQVVIADRQAATLFGPCKDLRQVCMDEESVPWACGPAHAPDVPSLHLQHPAYVIYTSGSTGRPKGVVIPHHALAAFFGALQTQLPLTPHDRLLAVTTLGFDIAGLELFAPLVHGACVVIAAPDLRDPAEWMQLLAAQRISVLQATPTFWQLLLNAGWQSTPNMRLLCGGEALPQDLAQRLRAGGGQLWNLYGPTEATIWASAHPVRSSDAGSIVPLGRPLPDTRLQVLDAHGRLSPIGVAGELVIAGPQLARGYLGRPDLTAERFVPDAFATQPGQRRYRSGDLARWRADGVLAYLGRSDQQIKLRGFRIEPGEIEAALRSCDGIREAAVVARADGDDRRLIAYLVGGQVPSAERLRAVLSTRLPEYMLPSAYMQLDALPLTANGKLDRRSLPAPDLEAVAVQPYAAPRGEMEAQLAELWGELLHVARVGRHDNFFALGGHSLLAVRLVSRIRSALGLELPLAAVFAQPDLAGLAQTLHNAAASTLPAIVPADRSTPLPLSFAQQRLWFLAQLDAQAELAYLMPHGLRLRGRLDREALRQALDRIAARHESLRTRIVLHQDQPTQRIDSDGIGFRLTERALGTHPEPHSEVRRLAELESQTPFDLAHDTLARAQLVHLSEDEHV
ncbi:non-ribosomal peptide synthetase, partial [Xanthomonas maliensis]|uniref:non-ribosomal peptide synthetase n=3 Tax=Xanthomonas maliensis TaxID=1321368 RepID=UPI0012647FEE